MTHPWHLDFKRCHEKAAREYAAGNCAHATFFDAKEFEFLRSIGCRSIEVFDFVEDEIDWETALLITAARRDYFLIEQEGVLVSETLPISAFPAKKAEIDGIAWLPRLILKARAKLRGELPDALMYCCGGDRSFFRRREIHPADFLRVVWAHWGDERRIVDYVKARS